MLVQVLGFFSPLLETWVEFLAQLTPDVVDIWGRGNETEVESISLFLAVTLAVSLCFSNKYVSIFLKKGKYMNIQKN